MNTKRNWLTGALSLGALVVLLLATSRSAKSQPAVQGLRLYVMDGGTIIIDAPEKFGRTRETVQNSNMSCPVYLIVHPKGTLLFDTGLGDRYFGHPFNENLLGDPPKPAPLQSFVLVIKTLKSQLQQIGYPPSKITYLALSHPHADHVGNANDFAGSTFLVHQGDHDMMFGPDVKADSPLYENYSALKGSKTKIINGDYDVFGDGTVVLLSTPGHTPGHQSLYVKLPKTGGVLLTGDVWHYPEDVKDDTMPEREKASGMTEASRKKLQEFIAKTGAQMWIGHDINLFSKLKHSPEFYD